MATQNTDLKEAKKDAIMSPDMYRSMFLSLIHISEPTRH